MTIFNIIGVVGVLAILMAYFLLQHGTLRSNEIKYLAVNIFGSGAILVSLYDAWNFPSAMIQTCWILISIYGIVKVKRNA